MSNYSLSFDEIKILLLWMVCQVSNHSFFGVMSPFPSLAVRRSSRLEEGLGVSARRSTPAGRPKCCKTYNILVPEARWASNMLQKVQHLGPPRAISHANVVVTTTFLPSRRHGAQKCCTEYNISRLPWQLGATGGGAGLLRSSVHPSRETKMLQNLQHFSDGSALGE